MKICILTLSFCVFFFARWASGQMFCGERGQCLCSGSPMTVAVCPFKPGSDSWPVFPRKSRAEIALVLDVTGAWPQGRRALQILLRTRSALEGFRSVGLTASSPDPPAALGLGAFQSEKVTIRVKFAFCFPPFKNKCST